jgi:phage gpG-like protein
LADRIQVKVDSRRAIEKIKAMQDAAADMQPVFATVGRVIKARIQLCFKLGIDPWGSPWAALKIRKGQPLRDTGLLQRSITYKTDQTGVTIGTNQTPRAAVHQFGAVIKPKNAKQLVFPGPGGRLIFAKKVTIPARPFMPLTKGSNVVALPPQWSAAVTNALKQYFRGAAKKAEGG